jgi:hypothetical protein
MKNVTQPQITNPPQSGDEPWSAGLAVANAAPRCGAKRRGRVERCRAPAMSNGRCRMHGGKSPGAPRGERNGNYRSGLHTREARADRSTARALVTSLNQFDA